MTLSVFPESPPAALDLPLLTALMQAFPRPILVVSTEMRVVAANVLSREILPALRVGDPLALSLRDPNVIDALRRVERSGSSETVTWRDRVPVERIFEVTVAALDVPDAPRSLALTLDDLTEARRIERMRADFIANASHELRTPLASLLGFVETLQGPARDDAQARARFLAIMAEQARRMARLVEDLLSLSRIEQKRHIRPSTPVDLSNVVRHVVDTLGPLARDNAATLVLDIADGVIVPGDRDELVRVAENLIENAIKYGARQAGDQSEQLVEIIVAVQRGMALFSVRDHGTGIEPEHLPRLTERFYRIDAGQSRAKGGTGLGLALVKHIVAHHRGLLDIESVVGEGSIFSVSIPRRDSDLR